MSTHKSGIADMPVELLIDNILPFCDAKDVFSLGCTNKFFALITTDDMFWKRKLVADYNFTGSETARTSGWKFIYQRLRNPRVFVWGYEIFSFSMLRGRSFINTTHPPVLMHIRPVVIPQREGQRSTRVTTVSKDDAFGCSFSGGTSSSGRPGSQFGSEWNVSTVSILRLDKTPLSHCSRVPTGHSTHLTLTVASMSGVRAPSILSILRKNIRLTIHYGKPVATPQAQ